MSPDQAPEQSQHPLPPLSPAGQVTSPPEPGTSGGDQTPGPQTPPPKKYHVVRWLVLLLVLGLLALAATVGWMTTTDQGSKRLLALLTSRLPYVTYQYDSGNFQDGLQVKNVKVSVKAVDVYVKQAMLKIGWRALLQKELHFRYASLHELRIVNKKPPSDQPFDFKQLKLPVTLRFDEGFVHGLSIESAPNSVVRFNDMVLHDAVWSGTQLALKDSSATLPALRLQQVTGKIVFDGKYPLHIDGQLVVPALKTLNIQQIYIAARGNVDTLIAGISMAQPEGIRGQIVMHPVRKQVPYKGYLNWKNLTWPVARQQQLFSKSGDVSIEGTSAGLIANIQTDLSGKSLPPGNYVAQLATNFNALTIHAFNGQLMGGTLQTQGSLTFKPQLHWQLTGRANGLNAYDNTVPEAIRDYLPAKITGNIYSRGELGSMAKLYAAIKLDSATRSPETWLAGIARKGGLGNQAQPLWIDARWRHVQRRLNGLGEINSPAGRVLLNMADNQAGNQLTARISASMAASPGGIIPVGHYSGQVNKKANDITVTQLVYQGAAGQLSGNAQLHLPASQPDNPAVARQGQPAKSKPPVKPAQRQPAKNNLVWQAHLTARQFNPSQIAASIPFNRISGTIQASGSGTPTQHTIKLNNMQLSADMPSGTQVASDTRRARADETGRRIELSGNTTAVLLFYPKNSKASGHSSARAVVASGRPTGQQGASSPRAAPPQPAGIKSFAVQFDGDLKTAGVPHGELVLKLSGTPRLITVSELRHNGAAGRVNASGQLDLTRGLAWQVKGNLGQFNPGFFIKDYAGALTGSFNTTGHWQANQKDIQLNQLNLSGNLKNYPLSAKGSLMLSFNTPTGPGHAPARMNWVPKQFKADNLSLLYAGNQLTANGDSGQLLVDVNAPALQRIHASLSGTLLGRITLTGNPRQPDALINVVLNGFALNQQISIQSAHLLGRIPQMGRLPGQLQLDIQHLTRGNQTLHQGRLLLAGTRAAHVLQFNGRSLNPLTQLSVRLAGGFNANQDWLGQLQGGALTTRQFKLAQDKPASMIYRRQANAVYLDQHCWTGAQASRLCLTEPLQASQSRGLAALQLHNLDISSFQAFMPAGVAWAGKLYGHARMTWAGNAPPALNGQLYTDNGSIGLAPEDPQDEPLTLAYQRLSLTAVTQSDGIKLRFDATTPGIGKGYIDATINPASTPKTINGALVLENVQLSILKPFFPGMRVLNGMASLAGGVSGPLTAPDFYGEFRLRDGQIAMNNIPVNLNRINLSSSIRGTEASISGDFYSGDSQARLTGNANWLGEPYINLKLAGDRLLVRQPPLVSARVTPRIDVRILPSRKQLNVNGTLAIPSAVISMPENNANVIAKSNDVRIVRADQVTQKVMKAARPWEIFANIGLTLGDEVYFRAFGTSIPLGGELTLSQRGLTTALSGNGAIGIRQNVTIQAFGQRLQLNRGIARFNGILTQPTLDIDATKSISNRIVGVRVTGRANNPAIAIYNDAGLSEQEALNALLTGRINSATPTVNNTAGFKSEVNNTIAAAGISMGLGGTRRFTNQLGRSFGLDSLTLDAEGVGDDTQVSLTGYITPDLYLRYGVGVFTPVNRLTLRYQLNRRLYIEASSALDRAVDMFYNWRF